MSVYSLKSISFALGLFLAAPTIAQDHSQHQMSATHDHARHQIESKLADTWEKSGRKAEADQEPAGATMNHAAMGHEAPKSGDLMDHAAMGHRMPPSEASTETAGHAARGYTMPAPADVPRTPIPEVTDADRVAAFAHAGNHAVHDNTVHQYLLVDRLEGFDASGENSLAWEAQSWIGTDLNKVWLRSEGERVGSHIEGADLEVLYGRTFARWWDVVAGIRHDFKPGDSQNFLAIGVMGLAPYKFEVEATAYLGEGGQTTARFEVEYETLLTNRLILQPLVELELHGKDDPARGIGSGLGTVEAGVRLRYEFTRRFAPYIGIVHERAFGRTADLRRGNGEDTRDTHLVAGARIWF